MRCFFSVRVRRALMYDWRVIVDLGGQRVLNIEMAW
jgi:hypothetical protein